MRWNKDVRGKLRRGLYSLWRADGVASIADTVFIFSRIALDDNDKTHGLSTKKRQALAQMLLRKT